jgi:hypothetical protein
VVPPVIGVVNEIAVDGVPAQSTTLLGCVTCAVGFTVIEKVRDVPTQLKELMVWVGITVIVVVTGAVPELRAVNEPIFPTPDAAKPIVELLLVQE